MGFIPSARTLAYDLMVFVDGQRRSVEGIIKVFDEFAVASGLKISIEKLTIYLAGCMDQNREDILATFPFQLGTLSVKYLGLPILTRRMTRSDYEPLVEKSDEK